MSRSERRQKVQRARRGPYMRKIPKANPWILGLIAFAVLVLFLFFALSQS